MNSVERYWRICFYGESRRGVLSHPYFRQTDTNSALGPVSSAFYFNPTTISGVGGIASEEAFGLMTVALTFNLTGIATAEAFGLITVSWASSFRGAYKLHVELGVTLLTRVFW